MTTRSSYWKEYYLANKENIDIYQMRYRKEKPLKHLLKLAKNRAKARGLLFCITEDDLSIPTHCPYLGFELDNYHPKVDYHYSIDRIDSGKGYIPGNVEIISHRANVLKNNATSVELYMIVKRLRELGQ